MAAAAIPQEWPPPDSSPCLFIRQPAAKRADHAVEQGAVSRMQAESFIVALPAVFLSALDRPHAISDGKPPPTGFLVLRAASAVSPLRPGRKRAEIAPSSIRQGLGKRASHGSANLRWQLPTLALAPFAKQRHFTSSPHWQDGQAQ